MIILTGLFLVFIGYREWLHYGQVKDLELKAFTKTPQEYASYKQAEQPPEPTEEEDDDLIDALDADPAKVLKGLKK